MLILFFSICSSNLGAWPVGLVFCTNPLGSFIASPSLGSNCDASLLAKAPSQATKFILSLFHLLTVTNLNVPLPNLLAQIVAVAESYSLSSLNLFFAVLSFFSRTLVVCPSENRKYQLFSGIAKSGLGFLKSPLIISNAFAQPGWKFFWSIFFGSPFVMAKYSSPVFFPSREEKPKVREQLGASEISMFVFFSVLKSVLSWFSALSIIVFIGITPFGSRFSTSSCNMFKLSNSSPSLTASTSTNKGKALPLALPAT
mmetsp:Transcript_29946/g.44269  ORF Transcript_29946/g.44269 Transcript_29946/m.44269 type:complete len:256 (-) Transcript_29946:1395-2162(-)